VGRLKRKNKKAMQEIQFELIDLMNSIEENTEKRIPSSHQRRHCSQREWMVLIIIYQENRLLLPAE